MATGLYLHGSYGRLHSCQEPLMESHSGSRTFPKHSKHSLSRQLSFQHNAPHRGFSVSSETNSPLAYTPPVGCSPPMCSPMSDVFTPRSSSTGRLTPNVFSFDSAHIEASSPSASSSSSTAHSPRYRMSPSLTFDDMLHASKTSSSRPVPIQRCMSVNAGKSTHNGNC